VYYSICITHGGVTTRRLHLKRRESRLFEGNRAIGFVHWVSTTTLLCSIFLPVLVKAIPCVGKDLGMCTIAYASLMVELQQDSYTSKRREESRLLEGNRAIGFVHLGVNHHLAVLYCLPVLVKAIPCVGKDCGMCTIAYASLMVELQQDGYTSKRRESRLFEGNRAI